MPQNSGKLSLCYKAYVIKIEQINVEIFSENEIRKTVTKYEINKKESTISVLANLKLIPHFISMLPEIQSRFSEERNKPGMSLRPYNKQLLLDQNQQPFE